MSDISEEGGRRLTGSRRRKLRLCNAVGIAVGAGRRGTGRLSNYPLKPNLRCCLKLTYANETAKSRRRRRRRLDGSQIGFRVLSRRHRRRKSERYTDVALRYITCWCDVFHLGLNASGEKKEEATNSLEQSRRDQTRLGFDERSKDDSFRTFPRQQYNP